MVEQRLIRVSKTGLVGKLELCWAIGRAAWVSTFSFIFWQSNCGTLRSCMTQPESAPKPDQCLLSHPAFAMLGSICFRKSVTDGAPVVIVPLGEREVAVPIKALQRELQIEDDSADGKMLALIADALEYATCLFIGDKLPREVVDGGASWEPDARHEEVAKARLQRQLLAWLLSDASVELLPADALMHLDDDDELRGQVQAAFAEAAKELNLAGPNAVIEALEVVAKELAYIEALRERFLLPVSDIVRRIENIRPTRKNSDANRSEMHQQVERLSKVALHQIGQRFQNLDGNTGEVIATLRHAERQCSFIRANRDWLYRNARAWEQVLQDWAQASPDSDDQAWQLLARTYHFLAPRYMTTHEWESMERKRNNKANAPAAMTW